MTQSTLVAAACGIALTSIATAQSDPRSVQFRSVDFEQGRLELHNFGADAVDLSGWRFCSFDSDQAFVYTPASGLNGESVPAGGSLTIDFGSGAPLGANVISAASVGSFAGPFDSDAYGLLLYRPDANGNISFGNSTLIADYIQWNTGGAANSNASARAGQAVSQGLWTASGDFIATTNSTTRIELTAIDDSRLHGPTTHFPIGDTAVSEPRDGDISDDRLAPTTLRLQIGESTVFASQQGNALGRDIDYLTVSVPVGTELTALRLDEFIEAGSDPAFLGIQAGAVFSTDAGNTLPSDLLGGIVYGGNEVGGDILAPALTGLGQPAMAPLSAGDYTFWFNQTGGQTTTIATFIIEDASFGTSFCTPATVNSTGAAGELTAIGSDAVIDNALALYGTSLPPAQWTLGVVSRTVTTTPFNPPGSQGNLCLNGNVGRLLSQVQTTTAAGEVVMDIDLDRIPLATNFAAGMPGDTFNFQLWHRDTLASGAMTSNLTAGVAVTLQ